MLITPLMTCNTPGRRCQKRCNRVTYELLSPYKPGGKFIPAGKEFRGAGLFPLEQYRA